MARRTLPHPPSDRYAQVGGEVRSAGAPRDDGPDHRPTARGRATGWQPEIGSVVAAVLTAVVLGLVGGVLGLTTGLVFVAGVGGAATGLLLAGSSRSRSRRRVGAISLAVLAVVAGAIINWILAAAEGGVLALPDYLWATTGLLVPAEAVVAGLAATWGLRAGPIVD